MLRGPYAKLPSHQVHELEDWGVSFRFLGMQVGEVGRRSRGLDEVIEFSVGDSLPQDMALGFDEDGALVVLDGMR